MKLHGNAALTPRQRLRLARRVVDQGWSLAEAAEAAEVSERTAREGVRRYRAEGERGLRDRPERVMIDNGSAYVSAAFGLACRALGLKHCRTRPYRPQTNGKAERFIRTMLSEWAHAGVYGSSPERTTALALWLERYNTTRKHGALGHQPPLTRLRELQRTP
jgi:transposase InsO family protein